MDNKYLVILKAMRLKRNFSFLLILILSLLIISSHAQEVSKKGNIRFGMEGGLQLTGVNDPYMQVSKDGTGYNFGPYLEYYLSEFVKIRASFQYDNRNFSLENGLQYIVDDSGYVGKTSYYNVKENFSVNYLTIPISIIFSRGTGRLNFYLQGSVYYSILLDSDQTGDRYVYISEEDAGEFFFEDHPEFNNPGIHHLDPIIHNFNSSDLGINIFVGLNYSITPKIDLSISPGFTFGFNNVWEDPSRSVTWSRVYKFTAGLSYKIK